MLDMEVPVAPVATVWLCRDDQESKYVAVRVQTADSVPGDLLNLRLATLDKGAPGAEFLAIPMDHFAGEGPNGTHNCLVLPLLGPRVSPDLWMDFHPANILVKLGNLNHLGEDELLSLLGQHRKWQVMMESGEDVPPSAPRYLVAPGDLSKLGNEYLTDEICVIDFGESLTSSPPLDLGIPDNYLPPELLLESESESEPKKSII